ncbi:MAG: cysteine dioxygenase family protein [Pseudoxanthomonas sp.]
MPELEFPGREKLIAALDDAIATGDAPTVAEAVRVALERLLRDAAFRLPDHVLQPAADHYARRQIHASAAHGYTVIAMAWGPGQGTPLHDHAGQWCVEGVVQGRLEVTEYALLERDGERFRFKPRPGALAQAGSTDKLLPPDEHHVIRNPDSDGIAVSLHVYQREMDRCHVFAPDPRGGGWYLRSPRDLGVD